MSENALPKGYEPHAVEDHWAGEDSLMMKRLMENDLLGNLQERWNAQGSCFAEEHLIL